MIFRRLGRGGGGQWTGRAALSGANAFLGSTMIRGRRSCLYRLCTRVQLRVVFAVQPVGHTVYGEAHDYRVRPDREGVEE